MGMSDYVLHEQEEREKACELIGKLEERTRILGLIEELLKKIQNESHS